MSDSALACELCGKGFLRRYFSLRGNALSTYRCSHCRVVVVGNTPITDQNLPLFYTMDAFKGKRDLSKTNLYQKYYDNCFRGYDENNMTVLQFKGILDDLKRMGCEARQAPTVLDVGCATGVFLNLAEKGGYAVKGVEISDELREYAIKQFNLDVRGDLIEAGFPSDHFDVVALLDVVEHFPISIFHGMINEIKRVLRPNGIIVIRTPDEKALLRNMAKVIYFSSLKRIEFPMHLFYSYEHILNFSHRSLARILAAKDLTLVFEKREEENPERLNLGIASRVALRCLYAVAAFSDSQHKMVQYYKKQATDSIPQLHSRSGHRV